MSIVSREGSVENKKPLPIEIEYKFLVTSLPDWLDLSQFNGEEIEQGYLASGSGRNTVRLRKKGDEYNLNVKWRIGDNPAERVELEHPISKEQFETFWPATEGRRISKTRYKIPYGPNIIELDVYNEDHGCRMLAEVEFSSIKEAELFTPPGWFGLNVTNDSSFGNANIAKNGFPDLEIIGLNLAS